MTSEFPTFSYTRAESGRLFCSPAIGSDEVRSFFFWLNIAEVDFIISFQCAFGGMIAQASVFKGFLCGYLLDPGLLSSSRSDPSRTFANNVRDGLRLSRSSPREVWEEAFCCTMSRRGARGPLAYQVWTLHLVVSSHVSTKEMKRQVDPKPINRVPVDLEQGPVIGYISNGGAAH